MQDLKQKLQGYKVYFVGVQIPLEILEQRERNRGTSPVGHARSHYFDVHNGITYDLEVDTSQLSAQECALKILHHIS